MHGTCAQHGKMQDMHTRFLPCSHSKKDAVLVVFPKEFAKWQAVANRLCACGLQKPFPNPVRPDHAEESASKPAWITGE